MVTLVAQGGSWCLLCVRAPLPARPHPRIIHPPGSGALTSLATAASSFTSLAMKVRRYTSSWSIVKTWERTQKQGRRRARSLLWGAEGEQAAI